MHFNCTYLLHCVAPEVGVHEMQRNLKRIRLVGTSAAGRTAAGGIDSGEERSRKMRRARRPARAVVGAVAGKSYDRERRYSMKFSVFSFQKNRELLHWAKVGRPV
jgi:hypothetical protein